MGFWRLGSEESVRSDLLETSVTIDKPIKEDPSNRQHGFPRYINESITIRSLEGPGQRRIEYLSAVKIDLKSPSAYSISRDKILLDQRTACMIKNIPNRYASDALIRFINETHFGMYDFFYLRMDFRNRCNVGYAFINLTDSKAVLRLYDRINGHYWNNFGSSKVAELAYASVQGIDNLKRKFRKSLVMQEEKAFRPRVFYTEGPHRGLEKDGFR